MYLFRAKAGRQTVGTIWADVTPLQFAAKIEMTETTG